MANTSYFFGLFKKFQSLGHVMEGFAHGTSAGIQNVQFLDAAALPGRIRTGATLPLVGATTSASPLWGVLNAKATGVSSFSYDGLTWFAMPFGTGADAAWGDFGGMPLVNAFANWIAAGRPMDIPAFIAPPGGGVVPGSADAGGSKPFVCSSATDDGTRPGTVPSNFWATSLIYLVDPTNGAHATPPTLQNGGEFYLAAVVGNRGDAAGGKYSGPTGPAALTTSELVAKGYAMAWGTGGSTPSVTLPSLTNNDHASTAGNNDIYFLKSMRYDTIGFRFPVQPVFQALILAIDAAVADGTFVLPSGVSASDYITTTPSHVCVKVAIRKEGETLPAADASPLTEPRIAQRNLARFDVDNLPVTGDPGGLIWQFFSVGAPLAKVLRPLWSRDKALGQNTLVLRSDLTRNAGRVHLAVPRKVFERYIRKDGVKGFEIIDKDRDRALGVPFVDHVVLSQKDAKAAFRLPFMDDRSLGMAIGYEVKPKSFEPGQVRRVELEQRTVVPVFSKRCYVPKELPVGGFTVEFAAPKKRDWNFKGSRR